MFFITLLCLAPTAAFEEVIKTKLGEDATLQFQGPRDSAIIVLKWIRPDLKSNGCVYYYRDNHSYDDFQHPSFHGWVELRDPEMKDGDISVILKNVNNNDTGTYECEIRTETTGHRKRDTVLRHVISLKVEDTPGQTWDERNIDAGHGHVGLAAGLSVAGLAAGILVVVVIINKKHMTCISCPS